MDLSVVVPTLNGRDRLAACLDALAAHAPDAEVIVVNGPSADGTTGMVRDREDVDVLVEISDRTVNVARNAGIEVAGGDAIALVDYDKRIGESWLEAVREGLADADVVTGPVRPTETESGGEDGSTGEDGSDGPERRRIAGRSVTYFVGGNVAFRRETLRDLDGFDEYLRVGGARDASHRLARMDREVAWRAEAAVREEPPSPTAADGGRTARDWGWKYRALAYRLVKNYGIRPTALVRTGKHAVTDAASVARDVVRGEATPSGWVANGRDVMAGILSGGSDGLVARARDRSPARNPNGVSTRADRAVSRYDARE
ncbi:MULTISPECIES: glycosyltransferase family 2 protein [Haloferacaceae]|uniref:Glycosyltransferase family 2 protein n=1 Tax=Halorubrum glutamatedens TaxID=2707018 RepID=A0ABD5QUE1_9EURY|nr:glycosyltransferase [Halobellus captivus]